MSDYSVRAVLSAVDKSFVSTFSSCNGAVDSLSSKIKSGIGFGFLTAAGQQCFSVLMKGFSSITSNMDSAISRVDTLNQYPKVMQALGYATEDVNASLTTLSNGIDGLPTAMDDIVSNAQMLAATLGDVGLAADSAVAVNDMLLAGGQGTAAAARGFDAYNKILAKGKAELENWQTLVEVAPGQMKQLAESMLGAGKSQSDLYEAMKEGKISVAEFNQAVIDLDQNGGESFASFATQAQEGSKGIKTSMANVKTAITKNLANAINKADEIMAAGTGSIADRFDWMKSIINKSMGGVINSDEFAGAITEVASAVDSIQSKVEKGLPVISNAIKKVMPYVSMIGSLFKRASGNVEWAIDRIGGAFAKIDTSTITSGFESAVDKVGTIIFKLSSLVGANAGSIASIAQAYGETVIGVINWVLDNIQTLADNAQPYLDVLKKYGPEIWDALVGAFTAVGDSLSALSESFLSSGETIASFDSIMSTITATIQSVSAFIQEHSDTIAVLIAQLPKLLGILMGYIAIKKVGTSVMAFATPLVTIGKTVGGLATKIPFLSKFGKTAQTTGTQTASAGANLIKSAQAFVLIAAGVLVLAAAFYVLSQAAVSLASAGPMAIAVFAGMVVAIVAVSAIIVVLMKQLQSMGVTSLTAAGSFLLMGAAILVIAAAFYVLASAAVMLADSGGTAIAVFFGMVAAIAALIAVVALCGPALTAGAVGALILAAAIVLIGAGALLAAAALSIIAGVLPTIASYGTAGAKGIGLLTAALTLLMGVSALAMAALLLLDGTFITVTATAALATIGIAAFDLAMIPAIAEAVLLAAALVAVGELMGSIAEDASTAEKALSKMETSVNVVQAGLNALGDLASDAIGALASIFKKSESDVVSAANSMTSGMTKTFNSGFTLIVKSGKSGMTSYVKAISYGGSRAVATARSISIQTGTAFSAGVSVATNSGLMMGAGFANGMQASLGRVQSIANQMVTTANNAIVATAKIGSPSRVTAKLGGFYGQGFINGVADKIKKAQETAEQLVTLPNLSTPQISAAGGSLSSEYTYGSTVEVPLYINGREFARATADDMTDAQSKNKKMANRKTGVR